MKVQRVIGKRIIAVRQKRWHDPEYGQIVSLDSITLENGLVIVFHASETVSEPVVETSLIKLKSRLKEIK